MDDKVLERLSWKAWKDKVLGGKREEREEEDFVRLTFPSTRLRIDSPLSSSSRAQELL